VPVAPGVWLAGGVLVAAGVIVASLAAVVAGDGVIVGVAAVSVAVASERVASVTTQPLVPLWLRTLRHVRPAAA